MEVIQFIPERLAKRWDVSTHTLRRWRTTGIGPTFLKLKGTVVYREAILRPTKNPARRLLPDLPWS